MEHQEPQIMGNRPVLPLGQSSPHQSLDHGSSSIPPPISPVGQTSPRQSLHQGSSNTSPPVPSAGQTSSPQSLHHASSSAPSPILEVPESPQLSPRMSENPSFSQEIHPVSHVENIGELTTDDCEKRGDGNEPQLNSLTPKSPDKDIDETRVEGDGQTENYNDEQDVCMNGHPVQEAAYRDEDVDAIRLSLIAMAGRKDDDGAMPYSDRE
jgi:hypothetical protein